MKKYMIFKYKPFMQRYNPISYLDIKQLRNIVI